MLSSILVNPVLALSIHQNLVGQWLSPDSRRDRFLIKFLIEALKRRVDCRCHSRNGRLSKRKVRIIGARAPIRPVASLKMSS